MRAWWRRADRRSSRAINAQMAGVARTPSGLGMLVFFLLVCISAGPGTMPPAGQSRHGLGAAIICALTRLPRAPAMPCSALIVLCARQAKSAASVLPSSLRCSADEAWAPGSGPPRARSCAVQIFRGLSIGWQLCWRVVVINTQSAHGARAARSVEPMRTPALYLSLNRLPPKHNEMHLCSKQLSRVGAQHL